MNEQPSTSYHDQLQVELVAASRRLHRQYQGVRVRQLAHRAPRLHVRFALGSLAGIAGAGAITVLVIGLGLGAGTQRASAEWSRWTAAPTHSTQGQTAAAEEACLAQTRGGLLGRRGRLFGGRRAPWHVLVADTRGPFTLALLQAHDRNADASCLAATSGASITGGAGGFAGGKPPAVPAGQIKVEELGRERFAPGTPSQLGHPYSDISGQVGANVSAVTLVLGDGQRVIPTIAKGWFLAWWPTWVPVVATEISTPQGTSTQRLHNLLNNHGASLRVQARRRGVSAGG